MTVSIQALEKQYHSLRELLPVLEAQGANEVQLNAVRKAIATSRDNLNAALLHNLQDDDPEVAVLISQMNTIQANLDKAVSQLGSIEKIIESITNAVDIGSQLASRVGAF